MIYCVFRCAAVSKISHAARLQDQTSTHSWRKGGISINRIARVYSPPCPWDTHYQFSIKNSTLKADIMDVTGFEC